MVDNDKEPIPKPLRSGRKGAGTKIVSLSSLWDDDNDDGYGNKYDNSDDDNDDGDDDDGDDDFIDDKSLTRVPPTKNENGGHYTKETKLRVNRYFESLGDGEFGATAKTARFCGIPYTSAKAILKSKASYHKGTYTVAETNQLRELYR